jgi:uncharacterized membrane protein YkvI
MGLTVLIVVCIVTVGGYLALGIVKNPKSLFWQRMRDMKINDFHKYLGYLLIAFSQVTIIFGNISYTDDATLGAVNMALFFGFWIFLEILFRCRKKSARNDKN